MSQRVPLCIDPYIVYFFTADWDPLAQKPASVKLKFSYIQLFLFFDHTMRLVGS